MVLWIMRSLVVAFHNMGYVPTTMNHLSTNNSLGLIVHSLSCINSLKKMILSKSKTN